MGIWLNLKKTIRDEKMSKKLLLRKVRYLGRVFVDDLVAG